MSRARPMAKPVVKLSQAEMYDIIRRPVVTEKTTLGSQHNQVTFRVPLDATKPEGFAALVQPPDRFSFPSGHAASSLSVALSVAAVLAPAASAALVALALVVGLSRCYLGVHYPGDVIAGWMLAVLGVLAAGQVVGLAA